MLTSQSIWLNDVNESASAPKCQELMKVRVIIHAHARLVLNSMPRLLPELEMDNPLSSFEQSRPD